MALLTACGVQDQPAADRQATSSAERQSPTFDDADLHGRWEIVSINGAAPLQRAPGQSSAPHLLFDAGGYGGTVGCNHFGGLGMLESGRYYALPGPQTAMACGPLTAQENEVTRLLVGSPVVAVDGNGTLNLVSGRQVLVLRRSSTSRSAAAREAPPLALAGTSWNVIAVDGVAVPGSDREVGGRLDLEADSWSAAIGCGRLAGRWRLADDRIVPAGPAAPEPAAGCASNDERQALAGLGKLMRASPRAVQGANGEMLVAGGHWASAARRTGGLADGSALLAGRWRIVGIDGRPPVEGRAAELAFGPASYTGSTGCNAITGLFLAHERRLFTHPGPQTEQGCAGAVGAQEARVNQLLLASPRIALAGADKLALMDARGELRLQRASAVAPGPSAPPVRALGSPVDALLISIDGKVLQPRYSDPESRLGLTADGRWTAEVRGVALSGVWRRRGGATAFFTDPPSDDRGSADADMMGLFNGSMRGVIDGNGDLLLAGDTHWLTGRVRPAR